MKLFILDSNKDSDLEFSNGDSGLRFFDRDSGLEFYDSIFLISRAN